MTTFQEQLQTCHERKVVEFMIPASVNGQAGIVNGTEVLFVVL